MTAPDDWRRLRDRRDDERPDPPGPGLAGPASMLAKVLSPTTSGVTLGAGKFFEARPLVVSGDECEGCPGVLEEVDGDARVPIVARSQDPVIGSAIVRRFRPATAGSPWKGATGGCVVGTLWMTMDYLGCTADAQPINRSIVLPLLPNGPCRWGMPTDALDILSVYGLPGGNYGKTFCLFNWGTGTDGISGWDFDFGPGDPTAFGTADGSNRYGRLPLNGGYEYNGYLHPGITQHSHHTFDLRRDDDGAYVLTHGYEANTVTLPPGYYNGAYYPGPDAYGTFHDTNSPLIYLISYAGAEAAGGPFALSFPPSPTRIRYQVFEPGSQGLATTGEGIPPDSYATRHAVVGQGQIAPWAMTPAWGIYGLSISEARP